MNIGEFFVNLAVKGADKAGVAVEGVRKQMAGLGSVSLETKAAIVGAVYALERLMSGAAARGAGLKTFGAAFNQSTDALQRWQYMLRQVNVSGDEVQTTVESLASAMADLATKGNAPEVLKPLVEMTGLDVNKAVKDQFYLLEKLQEFAKKGSTYDPNITRHMMQSLHVSDSMFQGLRRNTMRPEDVPKGMVLSNSEVDSLSKVSVAWDNLWEKVKKTTEHLLSKDGLPIVNQLSKTADQVLRIVTALVHLADKLKVFQALNNTLKKTGDLLTVVSDFMEGKESKTGTETKKSLGALYADAAKNPFSGPGEDVMKQLITKLVAKIDRGSLENFARRSLEGILGKPPEPQPVPMIAPNNNVNVNVYAQVADGKDLAEHALRPVLKRTLDQSNAKVQVK